MYIAYRASLVLCPFQPGRVTRVCTAFLAITSTNLNRFGWSVRA